jgi:hypothetical protein
MSNKFLIGIGAAFLAVFIFGFAAVVGVNTTSNSSQQAMAKPTQTPAPVASTPSFAAQAPVPDASPAPKTEVTFSTLSPAAALPVQDSDLQKLAAAVKLGQTNTGDVGKDVWAQETPVAEKLLQGLCDCDQRNWLTHFVKTGHDAISGSQDYYQSVQLLAQLRVSNQQASASQSSH